MIILPRQSQSATEVYVTHANVDWGAEALFARFADRDRDFIDIDVEALRGMRETVALHQPLILTECDDAAALPNICSGWGYKIFAFTRHQVTLKTDFQRMSPDGLRERWYKMVFLVPPRLDAAFAEIARPIHDGGA